MVGDVLAVVAAEDDRATRGIAVPFVVDGGWLEGSRSAKREKVIAKGDMGVTPIVVHK